MELTVHGLEESDTRGIDTASSPSEAGTKEVNLVHDTSETFPAADAPELVVLFKRVIISQSRISSLTGEFLHGDFQKYVRKRHALEDLLKDREEDSDERDDHLHDKSIINMASGTRHVKEDQYHVQAVFLCDQVVALPAHSFAFPILPSEWSGSPVRMAEADPRRPRKHQSWRTCFLCCM
ncbi:hypothetical protein F3Y22_tig00110948pilonHSYRG00028 [Hibiscus syriacus]|uniref:Uncharacterized protein n=1 Tax=Hibiscus syriacus TaxID=106335 RepID=A0A6A2ZCZ3_HIBSY|nr:hypothetical protein F3Y22_tig00110948pilonHSYRG00028 [Hibiscus syriacus]